VENNTVIEYRDCLSGKLKALSFDETEFYIQNVVDSMRSNGHYDFNILENPRNYTLFYE
jgi:hypothetical protein